MFSLRQGYQTGVRKKRASAIRTGLSTASSNTTGPSKPTSTHSSPGSRWASCRTAWSMSSLPEACDPGCQKVAPAAGEVRRSRDPRLTPWPLFRRIVKRARLPQIGSRPHPSLAVLDDRSAGHNLYINTIAVAPNFQGKGLGRKLIAFAETLAAELRLPEIRLCTSIHMHRNQHVYQGLGFREIERKVVNGYQRIYYRKRMPAENRVEPIREKT